MTIGWTNKWIGKWIPGKGEKVIKVRKGYRKRSWEHNNFPQETKPAFALILKTIIPRICNGLPQSVHENTDTVP
jgi:hypothetical protein